MALDGIVVLCTPFPEVTKRRVERAVEVYDSEGADKLILSGGATRGLPQEYRSEAEMAATYLPEHLQNSPDVILEEQSQSTAENLLYSLPLVTGLNVGFVSNGGHLARTQRLLVSGMEAGQIDTALTMHPYYSQASIGEKLYEGIIRLFLSEKGPLKKRGFDKPGLARSIKYYLNSIQKL